jgi:hypothetical protein
MRFKHLLLLPALSALAGLAAFFPAGISAIGPITFLLITLATVLLSTFLLKYELNQQPPLLPQPAAGKIGGSSFLGLSSFTGNLIALSLAGLTDPKNLLIFSWLNVLVVPYVLFAVYYQRRAVRQWSIGCLGLPVVLAGAPLTTPDAPVVLKIIVLFTLPLLAARLQVKTCRKNLENSFPFPVHS